MKTQKECVFGAIVQLFGFDGGVFKPTKEQLKEIYELVTDDLAAGNAAFSDDAKAKYSTRDLIRKEYVPGMVSNWIRKDLRLNGGEKYETKNPGSRAGQGDEQLKNLKALKAQHPEHAAEIDVEIEKRVAELGLAKKKQVVVDYDLIPEELRSKLGL
jgi:hypothetical protein